jgi:hypothetical protein
MSSLVVHFKCKPASSTDISFHPDNTIHVKGFASGLGHSTFPEELIQHILRFNHIVFDGDDLKMDSFTKYIACLAPRLDTQRQKLIAFKLEASHDELYASWQRPVKVDMSDPFTVRIEDASKEETEQLRQEVTIHYFLVPGEPGAFLELGVHALQATSAKQVVTFGGGECVIQEFESGPTGVEWILYDIAREKGGRIEEPSLRRLVRPTGGSDGLEIYQRDHPQLWSFRRGGEWSRATEEDGETTSERVENGRG